MYTSIDQYIPGMGKPVNQILILINGYELIGK